MSVTMSLMTIPFQDFDEYTTVDRPTRATVREIDAQVVDGEISFFFSKGNFEVNLDTYPGGLDGLLSDVRGGTASMPDTSGLRPQPPIPPLSLKNREWCYVIYRLAPSKNWQFARTHAPFSIATEGVARDCHFEARRIDIQGVKDRVYQGLPEKDGCMVAYFISNGHTATGFTGQYIHGINIHVDLLFGGADKGRIPLIIDPDIRFPGGSGAP